jgi:prepilin-type N-terminal cleavage/methylation domain-containing protein
MSVHSTRDDRRSQAGFTLIEMMVVLLVMAILLGIAIPTFLSSKAGAQDESTQSDLSNARISAKALYVNEGTYPVVADMVSGLNSQEPNLSFVKKAAAEGTNQISVNVSASGQQVVLVDYSASGTCWALSANQGDPPALAWGEAPVGIRYVSWNPSAKGGKACNATNALGGSEGKALTGDPWSAAFPSGTPPAKP